jgi:hypothetical protein
MLNKPQENTFYADPGWKVGLPWLYYERNAQNILEDPSKVNMKVSLGNGTGQTHILQYKLAKFNLQGDFLGWENLTNQIMVCPTNFKQAARFRSFGTTSI